MPGSSASSPPAPAEAPAAAPAVNFGSNKGIKFEIRAGTARWACTLQDRTNYERIKTLRSDSTDSVSSSASSASGSN